MPTYEYECLSCGHHFDVFQSMSDDPLTLCPECGKKIRRVMSGGFGVIFKGSGFYKNDSRKAESSSLTSSAKTEKSATPAACASCPAKDATACPAPSADSSSKAAS
jgi:putative FmdB family regulatory protein